MSPARQVRAVAAGAAVVALGALLVGGWGAPTWWAIPLLVAAVAGSEIAVVSLQFGRQTWTLSLTEGALAAAWALRTGGWTVAAVLAGVWLAQTVLHRPSMKKQFNLAMFAAATALGSLVAAALGGGVPGAIAGLAAFFVVNHALVGVAVAVTGRRPLVPLLLSSAPLSALHTAGNSSIGLLAAYLAVRAPVGLLGLLVPLGLLWSSYEQQTHRSQEVRLFAELAAGQERAAGRSSDVSARLVVTAAARLFGGADVELLLLAADGPVRYLGDETGVAERLRVEVEVFDAPWVLRALGSRSVATGNEAGRPWCSAVLGDPENPQAVLIARRPSGSSGFGRREVRLAEVLVGHADSWLSVADLAARSDRARQQAESAGQAARALGDIGAATAPSLTVLRESADRLARLADSHGGVDDIVEELHLVERAVASLLGAVALAADPDLARGRAGLRRDRPADDWTTTGVLR